MPISEPSVKYVLRIASIFSENDELSISRLALVTRMNYQRCELIVKWMEQHDFLDVVKEDNHRKKIRVTEKGKEFFMSASDMLAQIRTGSLPTMSVRAS
ncbi:MAG: hypothetical protein ACREBU_01175 [Nitrososphaera sp.]